MYDPLLSIKRTAPPRFFCTCAISACVSTFDGGVRSCIFNSPSFVSLSTNARLPLASSFDHEVIVAINHFNSPLLRGVASTNFSVLPVHLFSVNKNNSRDISQQSMHNEGILWRYCSFTHGLKFLVLCGR